VSDAAPPALGGKREAPTLSSPGRGAAPGATMRALTLVGDRKIELVDTAAPAAPAAGEVQIAVNAIGLNHIDVWGWRGMAFAKRKLPLIVGVEAAGEIVAVGPVPSRAPLAREGSERIKVGDRVVAYGGLTCGTCKACREGRDNLCENVAGIMGFHVDGFARDLLNMPARLVVPIPPGVSFRDAACAPVAFATVQHMLFDNAKLEPGETILVQAGGSGIGTAAIKMAKAIGCTVITTVGDDEKAAKAKALGADHIINYRTERFEGVVRKLTAKKGVDVAFEHVGPDTFNGSLLCLKRGGRLVTCGSTSGQSTTINLFQLYLQQYRIFGSFGASIRNIRESLAKMASGLTPVIDTEVALADFERGLNRLESRQVFGKIIVTF
jgi:alcohol dehydrogenase